MSLCRACSKAVVLALDVATDRRQLGVGRVLVSAARKRCEAYTVMMAAHQPDPVARLFWARVGLLGAIGPKACRHQWDAGIDGGDDWEFAAYRANSNDPVCITRPD
ncbi:hypothetical protein ACXIZN_41600 [Amycolatopsis sp. TRM77291]